MHNLVLGIKSESLLPTLAAMRPRRLALLQKPSLDSHAPMFTFLTDLYIMLNSLPADYAAFPSFLADLPVLTHFAIGSSPPPTNLALAQEILVECKTLRVLILVVDMVSSSLAHLPSVDDPHFLYQRVGFFALVAGWLAELRGGIDFWARGDAFVAKKCRGEIQPVSRCWIEVGDGIPESADVLFL
ncbi:hypothetical protein C8R45DRAFT_362456 [Mycena sanguinolenta]|nr:hypothetical protein C8R45DRAFT_362456 [Mycena sanguinolenta]